MVPQGGPGMTGRRDPGPAQEAMRQLEIDLSSAENGVPLSAAFHRQIHTEAYYDYIVEGLRRVATRDAATQWLARFANNCERLTVSFSNRVSFHPG